MRDVVLVGRGDVTPFLAPSRHRLRRLPRVLCHSTSLVSLAEEDKYYYKEVLNFAAEYNVSAPGDFYELLGVSHEADDTSIKNAFREKQRLVHPDIAGPMAVDLSVLLNRAYQILMDPKQRIPYDVELQAFRKLRGVFDGQPVSQWRGNDQEERAIFVDETTCIGCGNCSGCAPNTFFIEDEYGRARVSHQWADDEEWVKEAIETCPVDCIYYVQRKQLALLEFVMQFCHREDTYILARRRSGNMGAPPSSENPFKKAEEFMKQRAGDVSKFNKMPKKEWIQDDQLSAAIAHAWFQLPKKLRMKGWSSWFDNTAISMA